MPEPSPLPTATTRESKARVATAASVALLALTSAAQMLLFVAHEGTSATADGVLAAYSVYVLITVFAQGARISASAAMGGAEPRILPTDFAWSFVAIAVICGGIGWLAADPLSTLVAVSPPARAAAAEVIPVLGAGVAAQFAAVAWATIIGRRGHLTTAAVALGGGGVAALIGFVLLLPSAESSALAWATVISGSVAAVIMALVTGLRPATPDPRGVGTAVRILIAENLVPVFSTTVYALSMVGCAVFVEQPPEGAVSLFALAFLASSYLGGILGTSTAIVDTVVLGDATDTLPARLQRVVSNQIPLVFQLAAPALAVGLLLGPTAIEWLAPQRAGEATPWFMSVCLALLLPCTFATLATNVAFSPWFTAGLVGQLNAGLAVAYSLHIVAVAALGTLLGVAGVALAASTTTAAFAVMALRPARGLARVVASRALRAMAAMTLIFGPIALASWVALGGASGWAAAAAAAGTFAVATSSLYTRRSTMRQ